MQLSMFDEVPAKVVKAKRVKAAPVDMFAGLDLTGGGVAKMGCPSERREALVLRRSGETDEARIDREARENTGRLF